MKNPGKLGLHTSAPRQPNFNSVADTQATEETGLLPFTGKPENGRDRPNHIVRRNPSSEDTLHHGETGEESNSQDNLKGYLLSHPAIPLAANSQGHLRRPARSTFDRLTPDEKIRALAEAWANSNLPKPNEYLVIHLLETDADLLDRHRAADRHRKKYMTRIRKWLRRRGYGFDAIWTVETDNPPHLNIALRLPHKLLHDFAAQLFEWHGCQATPTQTVLQLLRQRDSGLPVHMTPIRDDKTFGSTGRSGIAGLVDYITKELPAFQQGRLRKHYGWIAGGSPSVRRLAKAKHDQTQTPKGP